MEMYLVSAHSNLMCVWWGEDLLFVFCSSPSAHFIPCVSHLPTAAAASVHDVSVSDPPSFSLSCPLRYTPVVVVVRGTQRRRRRRFSKFRTHNYGLTERESPVCCELTALYAHSKSRPQRRKKASLSLSLCSGLCHACRGLAKCSTSHNCCVVC